MGCTQLEGCLVRLWRDCVHVQQHGQQRVIGRHRQLAVSINAIQERVRVQLVQPAGTKAFVPAIATGRFASLHQYPACIEKAGCHNICRIHRFKQPTYSMECSLLMDAHEFFRFQYSVSAKRHTQTWTVHSVELVHTSHLFKRHAACNENNHLLWTGALKRTGCD